MYLEPCFSKPLIQTAILRFLWNFWTLYLVPLVAGYAENGAEVSFLNPAGKNATDGFQAERLEGMDPHVK